MRPDLYRLLVIPTACALALGCAPVGHAPSGVDTGPVDEPDYFSTAGPSAEVGDDDAALMRDAYRTLRAGLDGNSPGVVLADILAEEAHTLALAGMWSDAMLLWGEALTLLKETPRSPERTSTTPDTATTSTTSRNNAAGRATVPTE